MNEIRSQKEKVGEREIVIVDFTFRFFSLSKSQVWVSHMFMHVESKNTTLGRMKVLKNEIKKKRQLHVKSTLQ